MMIDRSSFDADDHSINDDSTIGSLPVRRRKDGLVRRKLRWKPPAFRARNNKTKSCADSITSAGENSNKTTKSFHTFHSTETPVQSNSSKAHIKQIGRPEYPDTFDGMVTIDNEGEFVHTRMLPKSTPAKMHSTQPTVKELGRMSSLDFQSISEDSATFNFRQEHKPHIFDPFGQYLGSTTQRPPKWTKKSSLTTSKGGKSPIGSRSAVVSPQTIVTALTMSSEATDDEREWSNTMPPSNELEGQVRYISSPSLPMPWSGADAAAGVGVGLSPVKSWSPEVTPTLVTPVKDKSMQRMSPMSPMMKRPRASARTGSPDPVLAKVNIDLNSPSSLTSIVGYSGLLTGQHYAHDKEMPPLPHKAYNRPVDTSMTTESNKSTSPLSLGSLKARRLISDDDSMSTRSHNTSMEDLVITNYDDPMVEDLETTTSSRGGQMERRSRAKTGPVDVDNGSFVEVESHLNAIHEMAAEHLAHGEYVEALEVFEEILRGQRERYGEGHYRVGTALHNIGIVHLKSGDYIRAVEVCQQAVLIRKDTLVPNHPDVAVSLGQLGVANLECKQYKQALVAFREALQIRRESLGPKHPKVGKILNNIGCALYELSELDGARLAFEEALEIQRESLRRSPNMGVNEKESRALSHSILLSVASTLCNIGSIKLRWGHYEEASIVLEEALLIQQSVLGDDHQIVLTTIKTINFVDRALENCDDPSPTTEDFFARWNLTAGMVPISVSNQAKEFATGCVSSEDSVSNKLISMGFMDSFRWDKSKRWYKELLPPQGTGCGPSVEEAIDDGASTSSWSFLASPSQVKI